MIDIYVNILCEGPSEEQFVLKVMRSYMKNKGVFVTPIILGKKGGVSHYSQIRRELKLLGKDTSSYLTTMLDYYKLPQDVPGVRECKEKEPDKIGTFIETRMKEDLEGELQCKGYIPNIMMHEYESLLFTDPSYFKICQGIKNSQVQELVKIAKNYATPEHINNSEQTAPSKRILRIYNEYQKVVDGTAIAELIGIEQMINQCVHFSGWVELLQSIRR